MSSPDNLTSFLTLHCTQLDTSSETASLSSQCHHCYDTTNADVGRLIQINVPPCQHIMCITCLTNHINRGHHTCPFCRTAWWAPNSTEEGNIEDDSTGRFIITPWSSPASSPRRWSSSEPHEPIILDDGNVLLDTRMWYDNYTMYTASDGSFSDDGIWSLQPRWTWTVGGHTIGLLGFRATLRAIHRTISLMRAHRRAEVPDSLQGTNGGSEAQSGSTISSYESAVDSPDLGWWDGESGERREEAERLGDHAMEI